MRTNMKKRIMSALVSVAVLAGSVCGLSAAEEEAQTLSLSPRAQIEIVDGEIKGITGPITAGWLRSQFEGKVELLPHFATADTSDEAPVPSMTAVTVNGVEAGIVTISGDANIDGKINLSDASAMLRDIAGWDMGADPIDDSAADLDDSTSVNLKDVSTLLKYLAGWDVQIFDSAPVLSVFTKGTAEYKLLANDPVIDEQITAAIKSLTGKDIEVITEAADGDKFITVGRDLYNKYDFIDKTAVDALAGEDKGTMGYIDTYGGNVYLTAHTDLGITGCVNYITNQAFTPELDMNIAKGTVGELGDLESLVRTQFNTLEIKGLKNEYRFLHVTDSHITTIYETEENDERRADVSNRLNNWIKNMFRKPSYLFFESFFNYAENIDADAILLTGDITDSPSQSNLDIVTKAVESSTVPSFYIYGNHDWTWNDNYQNGQYKIDYEKRFKAAVDHYDEDWDDNLNIIEYDDLYVISVDNSYYAFNRQAYTGLKAAFDKANAEGKPVILMLHIPFHTEDMHPTTEANWPDGGALCIGEGGSCGYDNQFTRMVCELITAEDSPVAAIFAGHVHFNYETMVAGRIPQFVTGAALEGWCRVVDLVPAE